MIYDMRMQQLCLHWCELYLL